MRIVGRHEWKTVPWKNGGGITHEILCERDPTCASGFSFRFSVAEVAKDGPFSVFHGVDRIIALVDGNGFSLESADRTTTLTERGDFFSFAGDESWNCRLVDGPVRDFNVMTDRKSRTASARFVRGNFHHETNEGLRRFIFCLAGTVEICALRLGENDFCEIHESSDVQFHRDSSAIVVELRRRASAAA